MRGRTLSRGGRSACGARAGHGSGDVSELSASASVVGLAFDFDGDPSDERRVDRDRQEGLLAVLRLESRGDLGLLRVGEGLGRAQRCAEASQLAVYEFAVRTAHSVEVV